MENTNPTEQCHSPNGDDNGQKPPGSRPASQEYPSILAANARSVEVPATHQTTPSTPGTPGSGGKSIFKDGKKMTRDEWNSIKVPEQPKFSDAGRVQKQSKPRKVRSSEHNDNQRHFSVYELEEETPEHAGLSREDDRASDFGEDLDRIESRKEKRDMYADGTKKREPTPE